MAGYQGISRGSKGYQGIRTSGLYSYGNKFPTPEKVLSNFWGLFTFFGRSLFCLLELFIWDFLGIKL